MPKRSVYKNKCIQENPFIHLRDDFQGKLTKMVDIVIGKYYKLAESANFEEYMAALGECAKKIFPERNY